MTNNEICKCNHKKNDHFTIGCIEQDEITAERCGCKIFEVQE